MALGITSPADSAFHTTLNGLWKKDLRGGFVIQARLGYGVEASPLFEPERFPRPFHCEAGFLAGMRGLFLNRPFEMAVGLSALAGKKRDELYFRHRWSGGLFPERSDEYRSLTFLDAGVPFQVQWGFTRDGRPFVFGMDFSGIFSGELRRVGFGFFWEIRPGAGKRDSDKPRRPAAISQDSTPAGPEPEQLEN